MMPLFDGACSFLSITKCFLELGEDAVNWVWHDAVTPAWVFLKRSVSVYQPQETTSSQA